MGLDTSHGCWHGAYSAFARWRSKLAEVAGYPPLDLMDGFYAPNELWAMPKGGPMLRSDDDGWSYRMKQIFAQLPIKWDRFQNDPLTKLLYHSDCDGKLDAGDCGPIADRLTELLPLLPTEADGGHIGDWHEKTQTFIDGLRRAAAAGEDVEFH